MVHLHVHDCYSLLDSTNTPIQLVKKAKELGMNSLAITNHGVVYSVIDFYKECLREGIKPVIGCEMYYTDNANIKDNTSKYDHIILLAKNDIGYKNLLKICSLGFTDYFYYKPRCDMNVLRKYGEGLIVLSACLGGTIPRMILNNEPKTQIIDKINEFRNAVSDFYLEVQSATNPQQKLVNKALADLSKHLDIPLVATSDVHFLNRDDYEIHGVFIQINQDRDNELYQDCWFKTEDEMFNVLYEHIGFDKACEAIENTHKIADMCNVEIELGNSYLPDFPIPNKFKSEDDYLKDLINKGFAKRKLNKLPKDIRQVYIDRVRYEYEIITVKNFGGYFLIVQDLVAECNRRNILLECRGSANNSLVCYVLGITSIDPIKYRLDFSRFLTLERTALPDADIDCPTSKRQEVINIFREKYGYDNVSQIANFGTLQAKSIIDAIGKVLGISYQTTTEIKQHIVEGIPLEEALARNSSLKDYYTQYPKLFDYCIQLEGLPKSRGCHAGGVVIAPKGKKITDFTALCLSKEDGISAQLEMGCIEEVGLVKIDILGVSVLDILTDCLDLVFGEE